jgi:hypothetical protein
MSRDERRVLGDSASTRRMENGMTNAPSKTQKPADIHDVPNDGIRHDAPKVTVVDAVAGEQKLEVEPPTPSGVLRELALACWRGLPSP